MIIKVQFWVYRDSEKLESFRRGDFLFVYDIVHSSMLFSWLWLLPMSKVWYFLRLPANRFESYHLVAVFVSSLSLDIVVGKSRPVW